MTRWDSEEGNWGGPRLPASPTNSYLSLAGHAQEEAEGPSQGGACPGAQASFQLAAAAESKRRDEEMETKVKKKKRLSPDKWWTKVSCPVDRDWR